MKILLKVILLFGFVVADPEKLNKQQNDHYRAVYCGLCDILGIQYSIIERMTLTYDLAFLILVISAVYNTGYFHDEVKCPVHTGRKHIDYNDITFYAADMNVLLMYLKLLDDKNDDASLKADIKASILKKDIYKLWDKYEDKIFVITECLSRLHIVEKDNVLIPDIPAGIFGELMAELFDYGDNEEVKARLRKFGYCLGKTIYIIDAATDLKKDIIKSRYNPLVVTSSETAELMIRDSLSSVMEAYKQLGCRADNEIIENILLSGIWTVYLSEKNKGEKKRGKRSV